MNEKVIRFGDVASLVGVTTNPPPGNEQEPRMGILLLNAGLLHRVGPNRLYVKLARRLAQDGFMVLRFDFSGIGDSPPRADAIPFEQYAVRETRQALDFLNTVGGIKSFILAGLCSGADVAFNAARNDPRVIGAILINPTSLQQEATDDLASFAAARTHARFYRKRLFSWKSWLRVIGGKSDFRGFAWAMGTMLAGVFQRKKKTAQKPTATDPYRQLLDRGVDLVFVLSEGSMAWDIFNLKSVSELGTLSTAKKLHVEKMDNTDHVFTLLWTQQRLLEIIENHVLSISHEHAIM